MSAERIDLLYLGVRESSDQPILHLWYDLTGIVNDGSPLKEVHERHQLYGKKKRRDSNIAFARLNYRQQQMLLAQILNYVTKHKRDDE